MEVVHFDGVTYPAFQTKGFASQFAIPYALHVCKGMGYDIGCGRKEWALPGAIPIDQTFDNEWDATNLPTACMDYIFSSHCLEHIPNWPDVLEYWHDNLMDGGVMFLYLPDYSQKYWRPWNNRKHVNIFTPDIIRDWFEAHGYVNVFVSGVDLNSSFMAMAQK